MARYEQRRLFADEPYAVSTPPPLTDRQAELADTIRSSDVVVRADYDISDRLGISGGFFNQHVTGMSNGSYAPEYRATVEKEMGLGEDKTTVYGYIDHPDQDSSAVQHYGEIEYRMKPSVREHTTVTVGDSLRIYGGRRRMAVGPSNRPEGAVRNSREGIDPRRFRDSYVEAQITPPLPDNEGDPYVPLTDVAEITWEAEPGREGVIIPSPHSSQDPITGPGGISYVYKIPWREYRDVSVRQRDFRHVAEELSMEANKALDTAESEVGEELGLTQGQALADATRELRPKEVDAFLDASRTQASWQNAVPSESRAPVTHVRQTTRSWGPELGYREPKQYLSTKSYR